MTTFLICGHGRFASGIKSSIEMIFGPQPNIKVVEFLDGETKAQLDEKMVRAVQDYAEASSKADNAGLLVFCDVLQGSPFQSAAALAQQRADVRVVYGTNVGMVVECVTRSLFGSLSLDECVDVALQAGRAQIGVFDTLASAHGDEEEDAWD